MCWKYTTIVFTRLAIHALRIQIYSNTIGDRRKTGHSFLCPVHSIIAQWGVGCLRLFDHEGVYVSRQVNDYAERGGNQPQHERQAHPAFERLKTKSPQRAKPQLKDQNSSENLDD